MRFKVYFTTIKINDFYHERITKIIFGPLRHTVLSGSINGAHKWAVEQASLIAQKGINSRQQKNVAGQIFTSMRHGSGM